MTTTRKPKPLTREQIRKGLDSIPMDTLLAGTASIGKHLTPKQREFARMIALGESKTEAYRKTHNVREGSKRHRQRGYELSQRRDIKETTEAFAEAQRFAESHTPAQLRAFVIQQLTAKAQNEDVPPATQVKCLELLGKVAEVGAFVDRKEVVNIKASGDIRSRIMDKLKLIGASTTIEHNNAVQDDEQDADSLLQELTGTGVDKQDADPTPTGEPLNRGVDDDIGAHIIPHNQTSSNPHNRSQADSIPHIQSCDFSDPHPDVADGVVSGSMCSPVSDDAPSEKADTGLEVDGAQMSPVQCTGENS